VSRFFGINNFIYLSIYLSISSNGHQPVTSGVSRLRMSIDESANSAGKELTLNNHQ